MATQQSRKFYYICPSQERNDYMSVSLRLGVLQEACDTYHQAQREMIQEVNSWLSFHETPEQALNWLRSQPFVPAGLSIPSEVLHRVAAQLLEDSSEEARNARTAIAQHLEEDHDCTCATWRNS